MKKLLAIAALVCTCAHAEFKDGNTLLSDMNGSFGKQMNAIGYVTGVADALMHITFCPPAALSAGQIHDLVKQHLEVNPATRHHMADQIIGRILRVTWPCAQRGQNL